MVSLVLARSNGNDEEPVVNFKNFCSISGEASEIYRLNQLIEAAEKFGNTKIYNII